MRGPENVIQKLLTPNSHTVLITVESISGDGK